MEVLYCKSFFIVIVSCDHTLLFLFFCYSLSQVLLINSFGSCVIGCSFRFYVVFDCASAVLIFAGKKRRRNSLKARPPPMKKDDPYYPGNDRRYDDLTEDQIPLTESLMDCMERGMLCCYDDFSNEMGFPFVHIPFFLFHVQYMNPLLPL